MDSDLKKLKKLTKFMQANGVLSLKTPEIELSLSPSAIFPTSEPSKSQSTSSSENILTDEYSPEDIIMWSAPGFDPADELAQ